MPSHVDRFIAFFVFCCYRNVVEHSSLVYTTMLLCLNEIHGIVKLL